MNRQKLAELIIQRLKNESSSLREQFDSVYPIRSFVVDELLPADLVKEIYEAFPAKEQMVLRKSLRENKYVAAQMNRYNPLLEEIVFAFQHPAVVQLVGNITGMPHLIPDEHLYAGGISLMGKGQFLNPHLDNSHDKDRNNYRVLNLLYYVSPDWQLEYGGNLELWDEGPQSPPRTITSRSNRLVVMNTSQRSYHSVSPVTTDNNRCCVSNYYFSPVPPESRDYFHVTSFRGRPEQRWRDWVLQGDSRLRNSLRVLFRKGIRPIWHMYKK